MYLSTNFKRVLCAVTAAAVCISTAAAAGLGSGKVTASDVNLRSAASISAPVISTAQRGQSVEVLGVSSGWYEVRVGNQTGYISAQYVSLSEAEQSAVEETLYCVVTASNVRFRSRPSTSGDIIKEVGVGTKFELIGEENGWTHLRHSEYGEGYIKSDYVRSYNPNISDAELAEELLDFAKDHLGITYRYGGKSTSGFDCSGFVSYVFENFGYSLCRVAADQYKNDGEYVEREDLAPGDLVFFTYGSEVGHVGIYLGDGEFIHSSSGSEYCVTISSLDNRVYNQRYCGAKRVL